MKTKLFWHKVFVIFVLLATPFVLAACSAEGQAKEPDFPSMEFVSSTDLFNLYIPTGWSMEEVIPGADAIMANTSGALARYQDGSAIEMGDFVLNVGFLPLALLQEKELSHLGIQFEASPDVLLQSLLPMFLVGDKPAGNIAGEVTLISLSDDRDAGMLTFSEEGREGLILVFSTGRDVLAFISAASYPGGLNEFQEIIYAFAAGVTYNGSQDALYQKLYGD